MKSIIESERVFYIRVIFIVYLVWLALFEAVGWHAVKLPTYDVASFIDRQIPLIPQFVWPYLLCYIFPFWPLLVVKDWHRFNRTLLSVILANLSAFLLYLVFPIAFSRPGLGQSLSEQLLSLLYRIDFHPGANKLPSLHVAFTWIIYLACRGQRLNKFGDTIVFSLAILITFSALFVKQYVVADVLLGFVWALGAWFLAGKFYWSMIDSDIDPRFGLKRMMKKIGPIVIMSRVTIFSLMWL